MAEQQWRLMGWDTFEGSAYPLTEHEDEEAAIGASRERLHALEISQPPEISGGQTGIQDQVFIIRPDGSRYRFQCDCPICNRPK